MTGKQFVEHLEDWEVVGVVTVVLLLVCQWCSSNLDYNGGRVSLLLPTSTTDGYDSPDEFFQKEYFLPMPNLAQDHFFSDKTILVSFLF